MSHRKALGGSVMGIDDVVIVTRLGGRWSNVSGDLARGAELRELYNEVRREDFPKR